MSKKPQFPGRDVGLRNEYVECDCDSSDHVIRMVYFIELETGKIDEEDGIYIETQLATGDFFHRVWRAIKYIFNSTDSPYWSTTLLNIENAKKMKTLLDKYINDQN